jgi:hypothetical protein
MAASFHDLLWGGVETREPVPLAARAGITAPASQPNSWQAREPIGDQRVRAAGSIDFAKSMEKK